MTTGYVADLSNNNGRLTFADFVAMKNAGYLGVILKASEGTNFKDPDFVQWAQWAQAAGLTIGGYHFGHADQNAASQATAFNAQIAAAGVPVPVRCLDMEVTGGNVEAFCQTFCPAAHINLLYSGAYFAQSEIAAPIPGVDWWIASYGTVQQPRAPWGVEAGWQFTDAGNIPGVGRGDLSVFDTGVWAALTGGSTAPSTPKVAFMHNPPWSLDGPWVADLNCPSGGAWLLTADGALYQAGTAPGVKGMNGNPAFVGRTAAQLIAPNPAETAAGYKCVIVATSGERYGCI